MVIGDHLCVPLRGDPYAAPVLLVGLTGGIGSGKSTVAALLEARGAVVVDADAVARAVVEPGTPAFAALVERFGSGILDARRRPRPRRARRVAFADEESRQALEAITHPAISEEFVARVQAAPRDAIVVCDVPLLAESQQAQSRGYAVVIVVEAPLDVRLERLAERGIAPDDAERRIAAQASDEERRALATHLIDNAGDLGRLEQQVDELWEDLQRIHDEQELAREQVVASHPVATMGSCPDSSSSPTSALRAISPRRSPRSRPGSSAGERYQTLLGITGSGKSFTIAGVIEKVQRPTIVLAPNKSLAAQLASEFRELFPKNRVEYFVSYYDYYQPEAYLPTTDTYIEKDSSINDEIDRLRHSATSAIMSRRDVIVVASVSAIYGLGAPDEYERQCLIVDRGEEREQRSILARLVELAVRAQRRRLRPQQVPGARRHDRGVPVVRGARGADPAVRRRGRAHRVGRPAHGRDRRGARPARAVPGVALRHVGEPACSARSQGIEAELAERLAVVRAAGTSSSRRSGCACAPPTTSRCCARSASCSGIENYSRHLDGRAPGQMPYTLLDYFPDDYLVVLDESHVTVPQLHGQYEGDRSRKETLVEHGFRLPSAMDNRPLRFDEFIEKVNQMVFMSATPSAYELEIVEPGRRADRAADRPRRPRGRRQADEGPDRRPGRGDPRARGARAAGARHHAHEEDGGGPHRLPARARGARPLPAQRGRHARAGRDPPLAAARLSSTCSSGSTCSGRVSTSPRCRWSRSSTPTRRASSARRRR